MIDIAYIINVLTYSKWRKSIQYRFTPYEHTGTHWQELLQWLLPDQIETR